MKLTLSGMGGELSLKLPFTLIHVDNSCHGTESQDYDLLNAEKCHQKLAADNQQKQQQQLQQQKSKNKHDLKLDNIDSAIRDLDQICTDLASSMAIGATTPTPTTSLTPQTLQGTPITTTAIIQSILTTSPSPTTHLPVSGHDNSNYDNRDNIINKQCQKSNQSMLTGLTSSANDKIEQTITADINEMSKFRCDIGGSSTSCGSDGDIDGINAIRNSSDVGGGSAGVNTNKKSQQLLRDMRHDTIEMTSIDVDEDLIVGTTAEELLNSGEMRKNSETTCVEVHATSS